MVGIREKRCRTCGVVKPVGCFHRGGYTKDGYQATCIECQQSMERKRCCCCKRILPRSSFHMHSGKSDGLQPYCKLCANDTRNVWKAKKAEEQARKNGKENDESQDHSGN